MIRWNRSGGTAVPQRAMTSGGLCTRLNHRPGRRVVDLNSSVAQRNNLWNPANLIATGVDAPGLLCSAEFSSNVQVICAGDSVTFTDQSFNGVTSRDWSFPGASPSTGSDPAPERVVPAGSGLLQRAARTALHEGLPRMGRLPAGQLRLHSGSWSE